MKASARPGFFEPQECLKPGLRQRTDRVRYRGDVARSSNQIISDPPLRPPGNPKATFEMCVSGRRIYDGGLTEKPPRDMNDGMANVDRPAHCDDFSRRAACAPSAWRAHYHRHYKLTESLSRLRILPCISAMPQLSVSRGPLKLVRLSTHNSSGSLGSSHRRHWPMIERSPSTE